jgi:hypothetical protein
VIDKSYTYTLVAFAKISPLNLQMLQQRVNDLFNSINLNQGKDIVSISAPEQHILFSRQGFSLQDELGACIEALSIVNGKPNMVSVVYPVFW